MDAIVNGHAYFKVPFLDERENYKSNQLKYSFELSGILNKYCAFKVKIHQIELK
jgi:hypothetical protein